MARDYYEVLGVGRDAGADEIQRAFRTLARRHHPDISKEPDAEERFKEINEAYQTLSDPATRSRYDRYGADFRRVPEGFEEAAGAGRRGRAPAGGPFDGEGRWSYRSGGGGIDVDDLFGDLFGGRAGGGFRRGGPSWTDAAGTDREAELTLAVEEAYRGGRRTVTLQGPDGEHTYEVDIPPGVVDGQRIRLAGQGAPGRGAGRAGDLYLLVRIAPHRRYRLNGRDITLDLPISPWEGVLGAEIEVQTPGGRPTVTVPPGSSTGRRLRLRGQGMPNPHGRPGDLYVELKVMVPGRPTPRERELFEELAKVSTFDPRRRR
jgi:curved DNA-binding protein